MAVFGVKLHLSAKHIGQCCCIPHARAWAGDFGGPGTKMFGCDGAQGTSAPPTRSGDTYEECPGLEEEISRLDHGFGDCLNSNYISVIMGRCSFPPKIVISSPLWLPI